MIKLEYGPEPQAQLNTAKVLSKWAQKNSTYIKIIQDGAVLLPLSEFNDIHEDALRALIVDYVNWSIVQTIVLKKPKVTRNRDEVLVNLEQEVNSAPQGPPSSFTHCTSASIFVEMSRTNFILMYRTLMDESKQIQDEIQMHGLPRGEYMVLWTLEKANYLYVPNPLAVMSFKQSNVMDTLLMMTERLDSLPFEAFDELKQAVKLLYTRNGCARVIGGRIGTT
jgi:hypothetical protein